MQLPRAPLGWLPAPFLTRDVVGEHAWGLAGEEAGKGGGRTEVLKPHLDTVVGARTVCASDRGNCAVVPGTEPRTAGSQLDLYTVVTKQTALV